MGLVTGLVAAIIVLVLLLAYLADCVIRLQAGVTNTDKADHAKCIAHVADVVSNRMVAVALRDLAERYDSVREEALLRKIRESKARSNVDGSVPALWMRYHADMLDGE
jgi:hypothetical protein